MTHSDAPTLAERHRLRVLRLRRLTRHAFRQMQRYPAFSAQAEHHRLRARRLLRCLHDCELLLC